MELSGFTESIHKFDDYLKCLLWTCPNLQVVFYFYFYFYYLLLITHPIFMSGIDSFFLIQTLFIKVVNGKKRGSGEYFGRPGVSHMMPQSVKVLMLDMRVFHCSITFGPTLTHITTFRCHYQCYGSLCCTILSAIG